MSYDIFRSNIHHSTQIGRMADIIFLLLTIKY